MGLTSDMRERRERHTLVDFIVVIGPWDEGGPIVVGAVEESTYDALVEEDAWETRKAEWHSKLGMSEEVPIDSLRDVQVTAWLPWLWEMPAVRAEGAEALNEPTGDIPVVPAPRTPSPNELEVNDRVLCVDTEGHVWPDILQHDDPAANVHRARVVRSVGQGLYRVTIEVKDGIGPTIQLHREQLRVL